MIGIFSDCYPPKIDGISISLERYINELARIDYPYRLFIPSPHRPFDYSNPNIYQFPAMKTSFYPDMRIALPFAFRELKVAFGKDYSLVHSHTPIPGPMGALGLQLSMIRGVPHFHTFHTYLRDYVHYLFNGRLISPKVMDLLCRWWSDRVDYLIVPSVKIENWLKSIGVESEIRMIPNGLDLVRFRSRQDLSIRKDYIYQRGLAVPNELVLLYVGRLAKEKSIEQLIRAFARLPGLADRHLRLLLVGDGPERQHLDWMVRDLGVSDYVTFAGYVDSQDIHNYYLAADVFTFLSKSETQGMVVAEAIACGLPVIVADDIAYDGMVVNGKNGFRVNNEDEFVSGINRLLESDILYGTFSAESVRLSARYNIQNITQEIIEYYQYGVEKWNCRSNSSRQALKFSIPNVKGLITDWSNDILKILKVDQKDTSL